MQVINWLEIQPLSADLEALNRRLQEPLALRKVCQMLVEISLRSYPWYGRTDLIPCFHPSQIYKKGQWIAIPVQDPQHLRPMIWHVAQVTLAEMVENPVQGRFQALRLDVYGKQIHMAGGVTGAIFRELDFSAYSPDDLMWLAEWVSNQYFASLQSSIKKLIQRKQICGKFSGEMFLPEEEISIPVERLQPFFTSLSQGRPWISIDEMLQSFPELATLKRDTALALLRAALKHSEFRSLGGDRWTRPDLFELLDREVPRGLPTPRVRSKIEIWTDKDEEDLAVFENKPMPAEARQALEDLGMERTLAKSDLTPWRAPDGPARLPTLNYLHITQGYFPVSHVIHSFAPDVYMVFVQFIEGEHQPFLLDRDSGMLKALDPESLRDRILDEGIPAGTYLWLEYQGGEQYRIAPRPLAVEQSVPCKLAYLEDGQLHIEHTYIPMKYEGDPYVFKANMRFEDIEALFAEARRVNLSVRDTIIYSIQELCAADPHNRAYRLDIFNAVFLKRMCSPNSVSVLLYTQPCFERLGGSFFRYNPTPEVQAVNVPLEPKTISRLWDDLASNPVSPDPVTQARPEGTLEASVPDIFINHPEPEILSSKAMDVGKDDLVSVMPSTDSNEDETTKKEELVKSELLAENNIDPSSIPTVQVSQKELQVPSVVDNLVELQTEAGAALPVDAYPPSEIADDEKNIPEPKDSAQRTPKAEPEAESPLVEVSVEEDSSLPNPLPTDPSMQRSKLPDRPLHKRPIHQRVLFYLHAWLKMIFRRTA